MAIFQEKNPKIDSFYFELSDKSMDLCYMVGENRRFLYVSVFYDMSAFYWCQLEYCMYHKDQDIEIMLPLPTNLFFK